MLQKPRDVAGSAATEVNRSGNRPSELKKDGEQPADSNGAENPVSVELSGRGRELAKLADAMREAKRAAVKAAQKKKKKKKSSYGDLSRALAIARRIMKGDKVPPKDESFLFRYNSDLYLKAKTMAAIQVNPKKHKSLLEDEEEEENGENMSVHSSPEPGESGETEESSSSGEEEL